MESQKSPVAEEFAVVAWVISTALNPVLGVVKGAAKLAVSGVAMLIKGLREPRNYQSTGRYVS